MQEIFDWTISGRRLESPSGPGDATDLSTGVPAVTFKDDRGRVVTVVFERAGALREIRFGGSRLTVEGTRHVRLGELADRARREIVGWAATWSSNDVALDELERRRQLVDLLEALADTETLGTLEPGGGAMWAARQAELQRARYEVAAFASGRAAALKDLAEAFRPATRPGRAGRADIELAQVAELYVDRCVNGGETVAAVAEATGMQRSTFSTQLRAARQRGLLRGSPRQSEVAGALTPKAKQILKAARASTPKEA